MPMDEAAFKAQFKKPPQDVIDFFTQKGITGPDKHWDWTDTLRHAHDRSFVVAKATSLDLLKEIKGSMAQAIATGQSREAFAKGLIPKLQARGWWGKQEVTNPATGEVSLSQLGSHRRLGLIYDTNMATAYDAGNYARMMEVAEDMPYWRYTLGEVRTRHRPAHQAMEGLTFRYDDPFWATHRPKQGFRCHCGVTNGDASDVERHFKKPLAEVLKSSKPEDFTTKTVKLQGKDIQVVGYRIPGTSTVVYPDPGWDYSPGDFSWRTKQLLADKVAALPKGATREAFEEHLEKAMDRDFSQYMDVLEHTAVTRGDVLAQGILSPDTMQALEGRTFVTKTANRQLNITTPLLLADDKALLHAIRDSKKLKGIAMPREMLAKLPELLRTWEPYWDEAGALLHISPPFQEGGKTYRWKVVFKPWRAQQGEQLRFSTATKVDMKGAHLGTPLP